MFQLFFIIHMYNPFKMVECGVKGLLFVGFVSWMIRGGSGWERHTVWRLVSSTCSFVHPVWYR